jgi:hypothetical protein
MLEKITREPQRIVSTCPETKDLLHRDPSGVLTVFIKFYIIITVLFGIGAQYLVNI